MRIESTDKVENEDLRETSTVEQEVAQILGPEELERSIDEIQDDEKQSTVDK